MADGKTISLDGLDVRVEEAGFGRPGEEARSRKRPLNPRNIGHPAYRYRVTITTDDGYRYEDTWFGSHADFLTGNQDFEAIAYFVLDRLGFLGSEPRLWPPEQIEAAKRLEAVLKRNFSAIEAGQEIIRSTIRKR